MSPNDVKRFEFAQELSCKLYDYFKSLGYDIKVSYISSYANYFKLSTWNYVWLSWFTDKANGLKVWFSCDVLMVQPDNNQFVIHFGDSYDIYVYYDELDFDTLLACIKSNHVMPEGYIPNTIAEMFQF